LRPALLSEATPIGQAASNAALLQLIHRHPYPLLFATISGAHLYGFASTDSDFDLRGVHVLPATEVMGLGMSRDTIVEQLIWNGAEIDLVTHDAAKFFGLMRKTNGYVLEQLLSPIVLSTTPEHNELKEISSGFVTRNHAHHYFGFARGQWELFQQHQRIKPLLYTYRVLMTGIHLMRTGEVQANIVRLNEIFQLRYIDELVAQKTGGIEKGAIQGADLRFHEQEYLRLTNDLETAQRNSALPEAPVGLEALNDLLLRLRAQSMAVPHRSND
jgi:predicted nucleotidyltransferase